MSVIRQGGCQWVPVLIDMERACVCLGTQGSWPLLSQYHCAGAPELMGTWGNRSHQVLLEFLFLTFNFVEI